MCVTTVDCSMIRNVYGKCLTICNLLKRNRNLRRRKQFRKNMPYVVAAALLWIMMLGAGRDYLKDITANKTISVTGTVISVNEQKKSRRRSIVVVEVLTSDGKLLELKIAPSCTENYQLVADTSYLFSYYPQSLALFEATKVE